MESGKIVVSIPTFDCTQYLRQAVLSILDQTYRDVAVYVVSDGEAKPPWHVLADLSDERLHRVALSHSRGPYFVHDLVLRATGGDYLLIQDADDWSEPNRIEVLVAELEARPLIGVTAGQFYDGLYQSYAVTFCAPLRSDYYLDRTRHHGLYRCADLIEVGGYYAGYRFAFDSYLVNVLYTLNGLGYVDVPLYHRRRRSGSLSRDKRTGGGSVARAAVMEQLVPMWRTVLAAAQSGRSPADLRRYAADVLQTRLGADGACERDEAVGALQANCGEPGPVLIRLSGGRKASEATP